MQVWPYFKTFSDHAVFSPVGHVTLAKAVEMVGQSIELTKTQRVRKLLIVGTGLDGFPSPTLTERFEIAEEWAAISKGQIKCAFVIHPRLINPQKFGVMVARNRGFMVDVFTLEAEARAWLLAPSR